MALSRNAGSGLLRLALTKHAVAGSSSASSHLPLVQAAIRNQHHQTNTFRALSTSRILRLATPVTGPTQIKEQPNPQGALNDVSTLDKQSAEKMHSTYDEELQPYPDYSKGPSALDKASQLFFFTEILRGKCKKHFSQVARKSAQIG